MSAAGVKIADIPDCPPAGPYGLSRDNFTELEAGVRLVLKGAFWGQDWLWKRLVDTSGVFRLGLKRREAWWCEGGVEELFGGRETVEWRELWRGACLPVVLVLEDEIRFRVVE